MYTDYMNTILNNAESGQGRTMLTLREINTLLQETDKGDLQSVTETREILKAARRHYFKHWNYNMILEINAAIVAMERY